MGTHPIFESDFDCLTEKSTHVFKMTLELKLRSLVGGKTRPISYFLAELAGIFVLLTIGNGSVAQNIAQGGAYIDINFAYGLGCAFGVYVAAGISGGHINPAVTLTELLLGRLSASLAVIYILGQFVGAFLSSAVVYLVYYDAIDHVDPSRLVPGDFDAISKCIEDLCGNFTEDCTKCVPTAGIFATYPTDLYPTSTTVLFFDQFFGTFLLVLITSSFGDKNNTGPHSGLAPYLVGSVVIALGLSFGINCGYAINPARDLGPRLFTAIIYGKSVFTAGNYHFWIPILGPIFGAFCGALVYILFIGAHKSAESDEEISPKEKIDEAENRSSKDSV